MVVSFELEQYMNNNHYTLDECARQIDVSVSTIKKWLYYAQPPSKRMLRKLCSIAGFFTSQEPIKNNFKKEDTTLAIYLAHQAETYAVKKLEHGKVKVEIEMSEENLYEPINLNIPYSETQEILSKHRYVLSDDDLRREKG